MPHFDIILGCQRSYGSCSHTSLPQIIFCNSNNCIAITFCFVLDTNKTRSFSLKRMRSAFLNIFFSHYNMLDLQFPNRHCRLLIMTIPILPPSLIILKKYYFQNLIGKKKPTYLIFWIEQRLSNITCLCRRWCCFLSWSLHLNDTCLAPCHHSNYRLDALDFNPKSCMEICQNT